MVQHSDQHLDTVSVFVKQLRSALERFISRCHPRTMKVNRSRYDRLTNLERVLTTRIPTEPSRLSFQYDGSWVLLPVASPLRALKNGVAITSTDSSCTPWLAASGMHHRNLPVLFFSQSHYLVYPIIGAPHNVTRAIVLDGLLFQ